MIFFDTLQFNIPVYYFENSYKLLFVFLWKLRLHFFFRIHQTEISIQHFFEI